MLKLLINVPIELKGRKKMAMKIIDTKVTKNEFFVHVNIPVEEFSEHVSRIKTQYQKMKRLKENIPSDHCMVHMDFAENYSCKTVYFN